MSLSDFRGRIIHLLFPFAEPHRVMVSYDILQDGLFDRSLNVIKVEKPLVAGCLLRPLSGWEKGIKFPGDHDRIDHGVLCSTGVYAAAPDSHGGGGSVEILIFQLTDTPSVKGIGIVSAECLDVKVVSAPANLLIRCEGYPYLSVFQ